MQKTTLRLDGLDQALEDFLILNKRDLKDLNPHFKETDIKDEKEKDKEKD